MSTLSLLHKKVEQPYMDKKWKGNREEFEKGLSISKMIYIGRLAPTTTEEQIHSIFSKCGNIKNMTMGLNKITKTPCGFFFVEYYDREAVEIAVKHFNGAKLDNRTIQVAVDLGFYEGRQYGRGKSGGLASEDFGAKRTRSPPRERDPPMDQPTKFRKEDSDSE
jgi:nuclear cap-binding protein subunit 2